MGANGQLCSRCQAVDKLMNFPKKTEAKQATPEAIGQSGARKPRLPLAAKVVYTGFVAILVPIYFRDYGPTNFLYFCDVALLLTLVGMWLENSLLISMCSVGILLPQLLWLIDFGGNFVGIHTTGMTNYMFDASIPLFTRGLSLFHGWLPLLLVWLLARVGYDQRALPAWTALAVLLVLICYFFMPPAGAHLVNPNIPVNINYVYGFNDQDPQHWLNQNLYVVVWLGVLAGVAFLPTHWVLRKIYQPARR
jgi:hypothetical protein